jgi:hypothetical protein
MDRNRQLGIIDVARTLIALIAIVCVFVVSAITERTASEREQAARARDKAAQKNLEVQLSQVYQVLQLAISRTDSCAVETDKAGNVIWMNAMAKRSLRLCMGANVTGCMTEAGAQQHHHGFAKAMQADKMSDKPLAVIPRCVAITRDGDEIEVSVETWKTPNGAMAFVTPAVPPDGQYSDLE